jgi:M6 family metalloprotease-like protein
MSAPFHGEEFTFYQPDGTEFQVRGWGDEHNARFETLDGLLVVQNPATGFYEYAAVSEDGDEIRLTETRADVALPGDLRPTASLSSNRAAARVRAQISSGLPRGNTRWEERRRRRKTAQQNAMLAATAPDVAPAPPQRPTVGKYVGLCLLVQFPDVPGTISREQVEAYCNQPGYTGFGNNGSVYDYFLEISSGKMQYTNLVAPYYMATNPRAYYTDEQIEYPIRAKELIVEALDDLRTEGFDFSQLTTDDEDYVYALNVFYAGRLDNTWTKGLWPHASSLESPYPLMSGKLAYDYQFTNMGNQLTLGTFCHENGHMTCDFPDLYDYAFDSAGVGVYCLMCVGGNATEATGTNPTHVCAYLKHEAGWGGSVTRITDGLTATATAGENQFFIHAKNQAEFFIVENRFQEGRDQHLTDSGLAIWHVDHRGSNSNQAGTPSVHYECALMQADGENDLENDEDTGDDKDLFHAGGNDRFGDTTRPNSKWWNGAPSGLEIHSIGPAGREMTFSAKIQSP